MEDKGKKDKDKGRKQKINKQDQKAKGKVAKQPKKNPLAESMVRYPPHPYGQHRVL
jgi:hypothetical protein